VYMCTVLLPPAGYPIAVHIYITYHISGEVRRLLEKIGISPVLLI
jgi:hypothetical protein